MMTRIDFVLARPGGYTLFDGVHANRLQVFLHRDGLVTIKAQVGGQWVEAETGFFMGGYDSEADAHIERLNYAELDANLAKLADVINPELNEV